MVPVGGSVDVDLVLEKFGRSQDGGIERRENF